MPGFNLPNGRNTRLNQIGMLLFLVTALVLFDQTTKLSALHLDNVHQSMRQGKTFGLGLLIHVRDRSPAFYGICGCMVILFTVLSPFPTIVKAFWIAAAISNHGEMILRHGCIDFLALRLGEQICVANVADLYIALGILYLGVRTCRIIRVTKRWADPVNLQLFST